MSDSVRPHRWQPTRLPIPGILQARTLEWVAISFSNASKWKMKVKSLSNVRLIVTPSTVAHQAPPSMGFFQARVLEWGAIAFSKVNPRSSYSTNLIQTVDDFKKNQKRQWHPTPVLLPGKIPWMEEPGWLQSMGSLRVGHD